MYLSTYPYVNLYIHVSEEIFLLLRNSKILKTGSPCSSNRWHFIQDINLLVILDLFFKIYGVSCGDLVYSGHNANVMIIGLTIIWEYRRVVSRKVNITLWVLFVFFMLSQGVISAITRR